MHYGVYLIIQRAFPKLFKMIGSFTLRYLIGLVQEDRTSSFIIKSMPVQSYKATQGKHDEMNLSSFTNPRPTNNLLNQSAITNMSIIGPKPTAKEALSSIQKDQDMLSDMRLQSSTPSGRTFQESNPFNSGIDAAQFSFALIKPIEDYLQQGKAPDALKNPAEYEEVKKWSKIKVNFSEYFGQKIYMLESWELIGVYYHQDLSFKRSDNNTFEQRIKKKEEFYSTVKKNLLDEDYASVLNSLIHTIFKEAMKLNHENNYTVFTLTGRSLIIVHARVQNIKLRKKLASMVVLRLLWKEFYERCSVGDLSKKES